MLEHCATEMLDWLLKAETEPVVAHLDGLTVEMRRLLAKYDIKD